MSKQETPNAATPPPASCLASGFISGSWPLGLRRSSLLGEGEPHGAEQDEVPASRTPCLPTFSAFAGEQEGWVARCLGTAAFPPGKEGDQSGRCRNWGWIEDDQKSMMEGDEWGLSVCVRVTGERVVSSLREINSTRLAGLFRRWFTVWLAGLYEKKILFWLKIYDRLR